MLNKSLLNNCRSRGHSPLGRIRDFLQKFEFSHSISGKPTPMTATEFEAKYPLILNWIELTLAWHASKATSVGLLGFHRLPQYFSREVLARAKVVYVESMPRRPSVRLALHSSPPSSRTWMPTVLHSCVLMDAPVSKICTADKAHRSIQDGELLAFCTRSPREPRGCGSLHSARTRRARRLHGETSFCQMRDFSRPNHFDPPSPNQT